MPAFNAAWRQFDQRSHNQTPTPCTWPLLRSMLSTRSGKEKKTVLQLRGQWKNARCTREAALEDSSLTPSFPRSWRDLLSASVRLMTPCSVVSAALRVPSEPAS